VAPVCDPGKAARDCHFCRLRVHFCSADGAHPYR
jgi:hypothetical protein